MAAKKEFNGQFDAHTASDKLAQLVAMELDARDSHKPGSILPELLETVRQFVVQHADRFDEFESKKPFTSVDSRLKFDL